MFAKPKLILLFILVLLIAGCSLTDAPSEYALIQPMYVQITPALTHWIPEINTCMERISETALKVDILPYEYLDHDKANLIIRLGKKEPEDQTLSILGYETINFIVNSQNPLTQISTQSIRGILEGSLTNWDQLLELKTGDFAFDQEIILFSYGEGNDLNRIFTIAFLENSTLTKTAWYSASLEVMLDSVEKKPGAIGYILESQMSGSIISLGISDTKLLIENLEQPVLAITQSEPGVPLRQLLLCLQSAN
ncbi:MAG: substrate-binding domain-containing protein [Anaerolineaceae bacterium]|nr:substrate-binding domain-containing protein [Anaerolineaceae bacterium]